MSVKPSPHSPHTQSMRRLYDYAPLHPHPPKPVLPSSAQLFQITLSAYVQGTKCSWGFISIYFVLLLFRGGEREKSTRCSFHYWPATKPVDEGKRALCRAHRVTAVVSLCCLCCSAPRHAGDNRNHPTAGGEDLRPGWLLVSVRRLEHHRNPEEPKSVHQDCLWVHFKRHYGVFSA